MSDEHRLTLMCMGLLWSWRRGTKAKLNLLKTYLFSYLLTAKSVLQSLGYIE